MQKMMSLLLSGAVAVSLAGCASSAQKGAEGGFKTVSTPATEFESYQKELRNENILSGIGIASSTDEMIARSQAADEARAILAQTLQTETQRYSERYAKNINEQGKKIYEEKIGNYTQKNMKGGDILRTVTQFNAETNVYKIYVVVGLNPEIIKQAALEAEKAAAEATTAEEEATLHVQSADFQKKQDAAAVAYRQHLQEKTN